MSRRTLGITFAVLCALGALLVNSASRPAASDVHAHAHATREQTAVRTDQSSSASEDVAAVAHNTVVDNSSAIAAPKQTVPSFAPAVVMERVIETRDSSLREQQRHSQAQRAKVLNARLERHLADSSASSSPEARVAQQNNLRLRGGRITAYGAPLPLETPARD